MASLENAISDIFTELDDSIFSDGAIDPMGLRIIWTALGGQIFGNRLNTISTDIRLYTLNLFNHYLVYSFDKAHPEKYPNLEGQPPYHNAVDIHDGLVVFLECLMTHALLGLKDQDLALVPGINKLRQLQEAKNKRGTVLVINKTPGILERHHLLGIHGRHKGPFREMGLFSERSYYANPSVWEEAANIFNTAPWNKLAGLVHRILEETVFVDKHRPLSVKAESILTTELVSAYEDCLQPAVFRQPILVSFWENRLELVSGEAGLLYELVKAAEENTAWEEIILEAHRQLEQDPKAICHAIVAIEPILTCIQQVASRLLHRATNEVGGAVKGFLSDWQKHSSINVLQIEELLKTDVLGGEARTRLMELVTIYKAPEPLQFAIQLIAYHKKLMGSRGNMPWLSISDKGQITHHRSQFFSDDQLAQQVKPNWVNNYYLRTVRELYRGLYNHNAESV